MSSIATERWGDEVLAELLEAHARIAKRRAVAKLERQFAQAFARLFRAESRAFVRRVQRLGQPAQQEARRLTFGQAAGVSRPWPLREADEGENPPDLEALLAEWELAVAEFDAAAIQKLAMRILDQALDAGAAAALKGAGTALQFDLESPAALKFLQSRAADLIAGIDATTRDQLRTLLAKGVKDGLSYDEIAAAIRDKFSDFEGGRARTIAVTEIGNAYEEGALLASQELEAAGLEMQKSWLTAEDDRVEEVCLDNAAAGWIALGDDFPGGVARPLQHPNCRCTMLSRRRPADEMKPAA